MTSKTGLYIRHRLANRLADFLADFGYWPATPDAQTTYQSLRNQVMQVVMEHPGMRCYEIEQSLRIKTPKQRVTNSILRDLEEDRLIVAINETAKAPRRYYCYN